MASFLEIFWGAVNNVIIYLMLVGLIALVATKEYVEMGALAIALLFVLGSGTVPEYDATRQASNLAVQEPSQVQVLRDSKWNVRPRNDHVLQVRLLLNATDR